MFRRFFPFTRRILWLLAAMGMSVGAGASEAPAGEPESVSIHGQATYNWQRHGSFADPRGSGVNSLTSSADKMYTFTATAFLGMRPWANGEVYFNPEVAQGIPFANNLVGLGGFTNGEITRACIASVCSCDRPGTEAAAPRNWRPGPISWRVAWTATVSC
jgi:hypothetical protein